MTLPQSGHIGAGRLRCRVRMLFTAHQRHHVLQPDRLAGQTFLRLIRLIPPNRKADDQ